MTTATTNTIDSHIVTLSRARVGALSRRFWERSRMAATDRAAREFESFCRLLQASLQTNRAVITFRMSEHWFRTLYRLAGDAELAFEVGKQVQGDNE